jgi:hypothetical protein
LAGESKPQRLEAASGTGVLRHEWNSCPSRLCETEQHRENSSHFPAAVEAYRDPSTSSGDSLRVSPDCAQDDRGFRELRRSFHAEGGEGFFQLGNVDLQAAALVFYVFEFVEGAEEAEFGGGVLFGVAEGAVVGVAPGGHC